MKNSGIEWIGEIPEDWEVSRVKNFLSERTGGAWGDEKKNNANDIICLRIADFDYSRFKFNNSTELTIRNYNTDIIEKLLLRKDDILVEKSGGGDKTPVGRAVIFEKTYKALFANFMDRLRVRNNISALFFLYVWTTYYDNKYMLPYVKQTTGIQNLDITSILSGVFFPLPPKSTQQRIASYLDIKCSKIEETIQNQQQVIEKLKAYKQSLITEAVSGKKYHENCHTDSILLTQNSNEDMKTEIPLGISNPCGSIEFKYCNLSFIADFKNGLNYNASDFGTEVKFLGVGDFQNYLVLNDESMFSNIITDTEIEDDYYLKNGDIIFVRSNGSKELVGRAIMVDNIDFKVTYSGFCIRLRNKEPKKINSKFLLYFFRSDYFRNELQRLSQGSNISNINQDLLSHIKIPLVDIRFQESVVDFLDKKCTAIDTAIEQKQNLIEKLTEYKKSLIYECVTGKKEI